MERRKVLVGHVQGFHMDTPQQVKFRLTLMSLSLLSQTSKQQIIYDVKVLKPQKQSMSCLNNTECSLRFPLISIFRFEKKKQFCSEPQFSHSETVEERGIKDGRKIRFLRWNSVQLTFFFCLIFKRKVFVTFPRRSTSVWQLSFHFLWRSLT